MTVPPPSCITTHEPGNSQCDGDPNGNSRLERIACVWRVRCAALTAGVESGRLDPDKLLDEHGLPRMPLEDFAALADSMSPEPASSGEPARPEPKPEPVSVVEIDFKPIEAERPGPPAPKPKGTNSAWAQERRASAEDLADHFEVELLERLGVELAGDQAAAPGDLYRLDRRHYRSYYFRSAHGFDPPIATVHAKPRTDSLTVKVPAGQVDFDKFMLPRDPSVGCFPISEGKFQVEAIRLGYEQATNVAAAIGDLVECGTISVPGLARRSPPAAPQVQRQPGSADPSAGVALSEENDGGTE